MTPTTFSTMMLSQAQPITSVAEETVRSNGPSPVFEALAFVVPLMLLAGILLLVVRGFRRVGSNR